MLVTGIFASEPPPEIIKQFRGLDSVLHQADKAYFDESQSMMSDDAYDLLRSYLDQLIKEYPGLIELKSVDFPQDDRNRVSHSKPVLSLKKVYTDDELDAFFRQLPSKETLLLLEPKIDGASVIIEYEKGKLIRATTRGDSKSGVDISHAILASGALPLSLQNAPEHLELRGEAYIERDQFEILNEAQIDAGLPAFTHARNLASGTLMLEDYGEVMRRKLHVLIFECRNAVELGYDSDQTALESLRELKLPVIEVHSALNTEEVKRLMKELNPQRAEYTYETDGWVIKVDDLNLRDLMGETQKFPRWAIARKYKSIPVVTKVTAIEYSISENGKETPIAILEPIEISGAIVKRATLHSSGFMESMGINPGCRVKVIRAGGVIPEIVGLAEQHSEIESSNN